MGKPPAAFLEKYRQYHDAQLKHHLAHPEVSVDAYSSSRRCALGAEASGRHKIYLDQKYWLYCRDAKSGSPQRPIHKEILEALEGLVASGQAVCPASFTVLHETLKQGDVRRRIQTAAIVDSLSGGLALQPCHELTRIELVRMVCRLVMGEDKVRPLTQMVWTRAGLIFGEMLLGSSPFDARTEAAIGKAMFDVLWTAPFSSLVESFPAELAPDAFRGVAFEEERNRQCALHKEDAETFEQAFDNELRGTLEGIRRELGGTLAQTFALATGISIKDTDAPDMDEGIRLFGNFIYHAFRLKKISTELPSIHISAGIHAAMRHQNRPHKKGDIDDHQHAASALPYCDLFLTEGTMGTLLTRRPLEYHKAYGCKVLWEDEVILAELHDLTGDPSPPDAVRRQI